MKKEICQQIMNISLNLSIFELIGFIKDKGSLQIFDRTLEYK